jgi:hypothetical protein
MVTSYWKTLKTVENLADKPHLTLAKLSKTVELFFGVCTNWPNFKISSKEYSF